MRNDEKMALESIYADAFTERVPGRVWEIRLELAVMKQYLRQEEKPNPRESIQRCSQNHLGTRISEPGTQFNTVLKSILKIITKNGTKSITKVRLRKPLSSSVMTFLIRLKMQLRS